MQHFRKCQIFWTENLKIPITVMRQRPLKQNRQLNLSQKLLGECWPIIEKVYNMCTTKIAEFQWYAFTVAILRQTKHALAYSRIPSKLNTRHGDVMRFSIHINYTFQLQLSTIIEVKQIKPASIY